MDTKIVCDNDCEPKAALHYFFVNWLHDGHATSVYYGQRSRPMTRHTIEDAKALARLPLSAVLDELRYVGFMNLEQVRRLPVLSEAKMSDIHLEKWEFLNAAKAFAEAHIRSDELDARDESSVSDAELSSADARYNETKAVLVAAYRKLAAFEKAAPKPTFAMDYSKLERLD